MNEAFAQYALLGYFLAYFLFAFVWRSFVVFKRTGINPFVLRNSDDAHGYVGRAVKLVVVGCAVVVALDALLPDAASWLGSYRVLEARTVRVVGWVLLFAALAWLLAAQVQMGASWRIGIDSQHRTALVQGGLFAISRNPIFLAMRVTLLGLFLVLPSAATLSLLVAGEILMQVQVRLEEEHLASLHGAEYAAYCQRVRRWL